MRVWPPIPDTRAHSSGHLLPLRTRTKAPKLVTPGSRYFLLSATSNDDRGPRGLLQRPPLHATGREDVPEA